MFTGATKIVKPEGQEADEFEQTVAQELFNLEVRELLLLVSGAPDAVADAKWKYTTFGHHF